jgi:NOL1/NOP2/fmu family ribosome biogenesis protein
VASKEIAPFTLTRVLNNSHLYGSVYKRTNLLKDLGELADIPNLKGLEQAISMLKAANAQAKGFRYEIEGAAWLARNEKEVVELTKRVAVVVEEGAQVVKTDIDVIILEGGKRIYYQFKRSKEALGYGENGLEATKAWVKKAMADLGVEDLCRVKYALPENVDLPPQIKNWFTNVLDDAIEIIRIPHLD